MRAIQICMQRVPPSDSTDTEPANNTEISALRPAKV